MRRIFSRRFLVSLGYRKLMDFGQDAYNILLAVIAKEAYELRLHKNNKEECLCVSKITTMRA